MMWDLLSVAVPPCHPCMAYAPRTARQIDPQHLRHIGVKPAVLPADQAFAGMRKGTLPHGTCSMARGEVMPPVAGVSCAELDVSALQAAALALLLQGTSRQLLQSICRCMFASLL